MIRKKVTKSGENWFDLNPYTVIVEQSLESNLSPNSLSSEKQKFLLNSLTSGISASAQNTWKEYWTKSQKIRVLVLDLPLRSCVTYEKPNFWGLSLSIY